MQSMELMDILIEVLYPQIIENNDMSNVRYFEQRMKDETITLELMDEAIGILEELLNGGELEKYVRVENPENKETRRKNLNKLVSICEGLAGVNKQQQMQSFY